MRLAIADPPYLGRSARWYGDGRGHAGGRGRADHHEHAATWDDPAEHAALVERLEREFDGWAIAGAASVESLRTYLDACPSAARIAVWHRGNAVPSGSRIASSWEPVIVRVPDGRSAHHTGYATRDVLSSGVRNRAGFVGSKPADWTLWVLAMLGYQPTGDELVDVFPGSGAVAAAADGLLAIPESSSSEGSDRG